MAEFILVVPGYAAIASRGGPDVFVNVDDLGWTDQAGLRSGTDVQFRGQQGTSMEFHFPFTTPLSFGTGPGGSGSRMSIGGAFVTFYVRRTVPVSTVRVNRIRIFDRLTTLFDTIPTLGQLNMPELAGAPPGSAGRLEGPARFINSTVSGRNLHLFEPPKFINKSIGLTITVDFPDGGVIGFTGAGIQLVS
ncbi:hypothetical protein SAMN04487913_11773 [Arthrobacter sp. ok362]|nr:hypothetical protein SAMN04487913_11773 [Arthrobacter sp. ok362]